MRNPDDTRPSADPFADIYAANEAFAADFPYASLTGVADSGLALVTCMDTRIDPLSVLGQRPGDAKIIRTAGARVTDDVLRSLVLAVHLLGAERILIVPHTDCGLTGSDDGVRAKLAAATGRPEDDPAIRAYVPLALPAPDAAVVEDLERIRAHPLLGPDLTVGAAVYDVRSGVLLRLEL